LTTGAATKRTSTSERRRTHSTAGRKTSSLASGRGMTFIQCFACTTTSLGIPGPTTAVFVRNTCFCLSHAATTSDITVGVGAGLTIVGGGPSPDAIVEYTELQQQAYSMWPASLDVEHTSPVYGFLEESLVDRPTISGLSWICSPGSPCSHVLPTFPRTPEFFFRFRFDTEYSEGTYCAYTTEFTLRLHGLPMSFSSIYTIVLGAMHAVHCTACGCPTQTPLLAGTTATCCAVVLLSYVVRLLCFAPRLPDA